MKNPSIGISSILGWATFGVATASTAVTAATASEAELNGPGKWVAILGIVSLTVTSAGRYLQSHALIKQGGTADKAIDDSAAVLSALQTEAQANVAKVKESPDGVDSSQVPFSGAGDAQ